MLDSKQFLHLCEKIINGYKQRKIIVRRRSRRHVNTLVQCPFDIHLIVERVHLCSSQYILEDDFFALDTVLLIVSYIYIACETKIYQKAFVDRQHSKKIIRTVFPNESEELINDLISIHDALCKDSSYQISIPDVVNTLPWNYCVLPKIIRYRNSLKPKKISKELKPSLDFESVYKKSYIRDLFVQFTRLQLYNATDTTVYGIETSIHNFLTNTLPVAPMINGTACVGKTTILTKVVEYLDKAQIKHNGIIKGAKHGGFLGKDVNQMLALQHQFSTLHMTFTNPIAVQDRDPFNNLLWRIIQALIGVSDDNEEMFDMFWELISHISPIVIDNMTKYPVIILVDSLIEENRKRMKARATGGDSVRSTIKQYVRAQNIVYGIIGTLCKWPIFNSPIYSELTKSVIINLIIEKLQQNQISSRIKNQESPPEIYSFQSPTGFNEDKVYIAARVLEIMK